MSGSEVYATPMPAGGETTPHQNAEKYEFDLRGLAGDVRSWASGVFYCLDGFHAELGRVQAPVWMQQHVNSLREEFQQALEKVRPTDG